MASTDSASSLPAPSASGPTDQDMPLRARAFDALLLRDGLFGAATLGAGVLVLHGGIGYATRKWHQREPGIYAAVVPVR